MTGDARQDGAAEPQGIGENIGIAEIMDRLPHRYPFLLIDRCEDYRAGESIIGVKCVSVNEPYFQGHFPGNPVMPGVLIVEAMAQSGAVLMSKSLNVDKNGKTILFMTLDNVRFRMPVRPGDILMMHVRTLRVRGDIFKFRGETFVNGKATAQAEWAAILIENPK